MFYFVIWLRKKRQSTIGVTGLREGGDVRGSLLATIMILDYVYKMHTY
jgi:hypothetical protein